MAFLNTKYKRKSAVITTVILALLILSLFVFGLTYFDPPKEYGIAVNFGTLDVGQGDLQTKDIPQTAPSKVLQNQKPPEPIIQNQTEIKEQVITQNNIDAPVIAKKPIKSEKKIHIEKPIPIKKKVEQKPDKTTTDVLNLFNGQKNNIDTKIGEGDDVKPGNKGLNNGDLNTTSYYGKGGKGDGGNYNLGDRKPIDKPIPIYDCNEEGLVVVRIEVDNLGIVINADAGMKGSTNSAPCLLQRAKNAALKTTWQPDATAPAKQIGTIIYNFSLSK